MGVSHIFVPVWIPSFYAKSESLYAKVSVLLWNGLVFTLNSSSVYGTAGAIPSVCLGRWWMLCAWSALRKLGGGGGSNGWVCAGVHKNILVREIYCTKPNTKTNSQSGSQFCKGIGTWAPQSIREYNLTTVIAIQPSIQTLMCKISYSFFSVTSRLKVVSTTWSLLPITPSTESTNKWNDYVAHSSVVCACPYSFFTT